MIRVISTAFAVLVITLLCGCTHRFTLNPEPRTDGLPPTNKSPVHAGIYYSPQFANQEYTRECSSGLGGSEIRVVPIGAASVRLFDDLFPRVFEKTSRISTLSADELSAKGVDVVIAPSLEYVDFRVGIDPDSDMYSVSYRTTLYTNRRVPVASWIVSGKATSTFFGETIKDPFVSIERGRIEDNMTDAAAKFLQGFEASAGPALTAIAKNQEGQTVPVNPGSVVLTAKPAELPGLDPKAATGLQQAGVVALQVTARSETERGLVMRATDMRLRLKDGRIIEPSSLSSSVSALERTPPVCGVINGLDAILAIPSVMEYRFAQSERELQLKAWGRSLFEDRRLAKGKEESGIVLFGIPKDMTAADGATLTAWVVDPVSADGAQIEVPLPMAP